MTVISLIIVAFIVTLAIKYPIILSWLLLSIIVGPSIGRFIRERAR